MLQPCCTQESTCRQYSVSLAGNGPLYMQYYPHFPHSKALSLMISSSNPITEIRHSSGVSPCVARLCDFDQSQMKILSNYLIRNWSDWPVQLVMIQLISHLHVLIESIMVAWIAPNWHYWQSMVMARDESGARTSGKAAHANLHYGLSPSQLASTVSPGQDSRLLAVIFWLSPVWQSHWGAQVAAFPHQTS